MNESGSQRDSGFLYPAVVLAILLVLMLSFLLVGNRFTFQIIPVGDSVLELEYGSPYQELGATADFRGTLLWEKGFAPDVTIGAEGTVDPNTTGTYTVTYSANYLYWHADAVRTIHVVDRKPPELALEGRTEVYVHPGENYEEIGFAAWDEYDGDLTALVQQQERDGVITYWVCDSAGNRAEATRQVHYEDPVPPEILLEEGERITWLAGVEFVDPGWTALDNCDGDLTDQVLCQGEVSLYFLGEYVLNYTVEDSFGNVTTIERIVEVVPQTMPEIVEPEGKVIYLTFDDGPGPYTRELLAVLEKYNVKATFFVVCNRYADVIGEIAAAGHTVGIHTACHDYRTIYASVEAYVADLDQVQQLILEQTGEPAAILRFPGGSSNKVSRFNKGIMTRLTEAVNAAGFQYFDWNVDSNDAGGAKTATEVYRNVIRGVSNRKVSIVLQHDIKDFSVDAVERIIKWGLENGYTFLPLEANSPTAQHTLNN